jgi:hypothetical protein
MSISVSNLMQFLKQSNQYPPFVEPTRSLPCTKRLPFVHNLTFSGRSKGFMNFWICGPLVSGAVSPKSVRAPTIGCPRLIQATLRIWSLHSPPAARGRGMPLWQSRLIVTGRSISVYLFTHVYCCWIETFLKTRNGHTAWDSVVSVLKCPLISNSGLCFV